MSKILATADCTTIDFLRHGECEGGEIFRGSGTDVPLTGNGWDQMRNAIQSAEDWDQIITSPLQRCRLFAAEQSSQLSISLHEETDWREINFGDWEGKIIADVWQQSPDLVAEYFKRPDLSTPHNGEPFLDVADRLIAAWNRLLIEYRNQHILVVQHGGTMRILLAQILGLPPTAMNQFEVPYACFTRLKVFHHPEYTDFSMLISHNSGSQKR